MAITYRQILRQAAQRIGAVTGVTPTALESAYMTSPLTSTQIGTTDFTISMIIDSMLAAVGRIVRAYASTPNHPFRTYNLSQTANIANEAVIPSVNSTSKPIVGVYGAIKDSTTADPLTEQPIHIIQTIVDDTDNFLKGEYFYYKIVGERMYHTRTNVTIDVCTFDLTTELAAVAAGNAPIPDACLDIAVMGLVASLFIDDEFTGQAQMAAQYFENALSEMMTGKTQILPAPTLINSQAAAVS